MENHKITAHNKSHTVSLQYVGITEWPHAILVPRELKPSYYSSSYNNGRPSCSQFGFTCCCVRNERSLLKSKPLEAAAFALGLSAPAFVFRVVVSPPTFSCWDPPNFQSTSRESRGNSLWPSMSDLLVSPRPRDGNWWEFININAHISSAYQSKSLSILHTIPKYFSKQIAHSYQLIGRQT